MKNNKNLNCGFIGILSLLIVVAIIIFFIVRTDLFTGQKEGKNMIEQGMSDIDKARDAKNLLEQNNKQLLNEVQ